MQVKCWGARGSIAISNKNSVHAGGNTTCYEIISQCLPEGNKLFIDAGTGFVPAGWSYLPLMKNGKLIFNILFTHYHWDHILGLTLSPTTFITDIPVNMYGPVDNGVGVHDMVNHLFKKPFFPIEASRVKHHMTFKDLHNYEGHVMAVHPEGGFQTYKLDRFVYLEQKGRLPINSSSFPVDECLVIKMQKANHGNSNCITYRFEERPTGKVFVLATDHENYDVPPLEIRQHFANADLLIIDAQYSENKYMATAGYGHGTSQGAIKQGVIANAKRVGLTHHDPVSQDAYLEDVILSEAKDLLGNYSSTPDMLRKYSIEEVILTDQNVFLCYDYQEYEV